MRNNIKELLKEIPNGVEEPNNMGTEISYDIEDEFVLTTGEHFGRIANASVFTAKNGNKYTKVTIGTVKKYGGKNIVHELERVYIADFHSNSEMVKLFDELGCIDKRKCYIERAFNKKIKFKVEEKTENTSMYKYLVTEITPVQEIPEEYDFNYVKTFNGLSYDYNPVLLNAEKSLNSSTSKNNNFLFDEVEIDFDK